MCSLERRFAGTVGADRGTYLTCRNRQRHVGQRTYASASEADARDGSSPSAGGGAEIPRVTWVSELMDGETTDTPTL